MIFLWLALVATAFGLAGFFMHKFYFRKESRVDSLEKEIGSMTRLLARRDQAKVEVEQQLAAAKGRIRALELQLAQGIEQMEVLRARVRLQEDELELLQRAAAEANAMVEPSAEPTGMDTGTGQPGEGTVAGEKERMPMWKYNLKNIPEMLDRIEQKKE